ncbi:hypothetical protein [Aquabacterium sp.]|uniref:hypothetical protein n=1 Tax=Aquabacterium sp. TaxID=1872578 RepID=UPI0025C28BE5|nr:hypothetical protein [Aquabacterium sp.]
MNFFQLGGHRQKGMIMKKILIQVLGAALLCHPVYGLAAAPEAKAACDADSGSGQYAINCAVGAGVGAVALPVAGAVLGCAVGILSKWGMSLFSSSPAAQCPIPAGGGVAPESTLVLPGKVQ